MASGVAHGEEPAADPDGTGQDIRVGPSRSLAPQKISGFIVLLDEIVLAVDNAGSNRVSDAVERIPEGRHAQELPARYALPPPTHTQVRSMLPDGRIAHTRTNHRIVARCIDVAVEDRYTPCFGMDAIERTRIESIFLPWIRGSCEEIPRAIELRDDVGEVAARLSSAHRIDYRGTALDCGCGGKEKFNPGVAKEVPQCQPTGAARSGAIRAIWCELCKNALDFFAAYAIGGQRIIPAGRIDAFVRRGDAEKLGSEAVRPGPDGRRARGQRVFQDQSRTARTLTFRLNIA